MNPLPLGEDAPDLNIERMAVAADGALWLGLWVQGIYRIPAAASDGYALLPGSANAATSTGTGSCDRYSNSSRPKTLVIKPSGQSLPGHSFGCSATLKVPKEMATGYFHCLLAEADAFGSALIVAY